MKALVLEGSKQLNLRDVPGPVPASGDVLVSVAATGIGGSEYLGFANPGIRPLPNIMGHGFAGTVEGRRVAVYPLSGCGHCCYCDDERVQLCPEWSLTGVHTSGGFAQQVAVPEGALVTLPDALSWEQSVFIEPFANAINAWAQSGAGADWAVAVLGAGGLGLGLVACASEAGCKRVDVSDPAPSRQAVAQALGSRQLKGDAEGKFDVVFDTVGSVQTRNLAIQLTRKGGRCVFLGFAAPAQEVNFSELIRHEKTLIGSFVFSMAQFRQAVQLAQRCRSEWVTNLGFAEVEPLLSRFLEDDFSVVKAALRPNG